MKNTKRFATATVFFLTLLIAGQSWSMGIRPPRNASRSTPAATPTPKPAPPTATPAPPSQTGEFTPLWVGKHPDAVNWAGYVDEALELYGKALLKGPGDVESFCPMYNRLGHRDQQNFWIELLAAMVKYESAFKPTTRFQEPSSLGIDPITGKQVVSEGLLQLSYQDEKYLKAHLPEGVCDFDWATDKKLAIDDIRRTIFDPKTNLTCGIWILNRQVERKGDIAVSSGAYWSVIKTSAKHNKLKEIRKITKALPFCT